MSFKLENVVPLGRNFNEYTKMFNLSNEDYQKKILGCADGPASFNYEASKKGANITSVDPLYSYSKEQISQRIDETFKIVIEQAEKNKDKFVWKNFKDVAELGKARSDAMNLFLSDYEKGVEEKRYLLGELPSLNFENNSFDIALCSHFLFLYSDNFDLDFHIKSIEEMLRVAKEVRIFPILDLNANVSKHYNPVTEYFISKNFIVEEKTVDYEVQKGGNKMLKIKQI